MSKPRLRRADLIYAVESFVSQRLARIEKNVVVYSLNSYAPIVSKLQNIKKAMGYDFSFVEQCVENVGLSKAINSLDAMSQLVMKSNKKQPKKSKTHKHTKTQPLLGETDTVTLEELLLDETE